MKNIAVVGAGTMGNGIAHVFALAGFQVTMIDVFQDALDKALIVIANNLDRMIKKDLIDTETKANVLSRITTAIDMTSSLKNIDFFIEAATENIELKKKIFREADGLLPETAIMATNTSSISITEIAAVTTRPSKVIGMHFMNPVPVMKLVEVIRGYDTSSQTTNQVLELSKSLGKIPVEVNDYPGFVANRILMPMINEAIYTLYEGVGGVEEIDTVMKLGMAHPMGPLQLADFIGLDVCLWIMEVLYDGFGNPKYSPCPLLKNMVAAGKKGVKSGEGFYTYSADKREAKVSSQFN